jgi:hypothetical protein
MSGELSTATLSPEQKKNIQQGIEFAEKLMNSINDFLLDPSTMKFITTSQYVKDYMESDALNELAIHDECRDLNNALAKRMIDFWEGVLKSSNVISQGQKIPLSQVSKIIYGLESSIKWEKTSAALGKTDLKKFFQALIGLMGKLMNKIHADHSLATGDQAYVGPLLSLLSLGSTVMKGNILHLVANTSSEASSANILQLTSIAEASGDSLFVKIMENVIECLLSTSAEKFDTRQVGKMVYNLAVLIRDRHLVLPEGNGTLCINIAMLASQLVRFSKSLLLTEYREFGHKSSPGYVNHIAVDNLCRGLEIFFKNKILDWQNEDHLKLAIKIAGFIKKASIQNNADESFLRASRFFVSEAIKNVSKDSIQSFNEALNALKELERRLSKSSSQPVNNQ